MRVLAVFREALAVIRQHRDQRILRPRFPGDRVEEPPQLLVRVGDLSVVWPVPVLLPERIGRIVRNVRIVHVYPQEEGLSRLRVEPLDRAIYNLSRAALGFRRCRPACGRRHLVIVDGEPLVEAKAPFQHRGPNERRRVPSLVLEDLGQLGFRWGQHKPSRVADLMYGRIDAGHHAGVRWRRERSGCDCVFEQHSLPGDPIQVGSFDLGVAVAPQPVGAQRVDRHQQQVQLRGRRSAAGFAGAKGHQAHQAQPPTQIPRRHPHTLSQWGESSSTGRPERGSGCPRARRGRAAPAHARRCRRRW